ncbi:MAG: hypothetical protein RL748_468 [Pseudomonadota bacterium]|jgi:putative ubiquitin-RnfH superfamily antitoxin RatB of RatAB toxin-antitoxin module
MENPENQNKALLAVQLCYMRPDLQVLQDLQLAAGSTLQQAIMASGILQQAPEIDLNVNKVGIFNKIKPLDTVLRMHDRIEIYRPLVADPKTARRQRVEEKRLRLARIQSMPRNKV